MLQPQLYKLKLDKLFLAPAYSRMMQLGTYAWHNAEERVSSDVDGKHDLFTGMMNARDDKRGLEFTFKDMWLETILMLGAGTLPELTDVCSADPIHRRDH